ncbi:MAG: tRNA (adenosine(37)-N6)-dimethylallyltransferase MiaA [Candidatus Buchananbacteria bacterium]
MPSSKPKLIVILGPTATGKTKLAVSLARKFKGEIISADSRQVYRGMDIGTGKDLREYGLKSPSVASKRASGRASGGSKTASAVPYHLIDIIRPQADFNVAKYQKLAYKAIGDVQSRGKLPMLVGGTGLYIDAVIKGYEFMEHGTYNIKQIRQKLEKLTLAQLLVKLKKIDSETFDKIDKKNRRRVQRAVEIFYETGKTKSEIDKKSPPDYDILVLGIKYPLEKIYGKIDKRLSGRMKEGMIREVKSLRQQGVSWKKLDGFGLEYRYVSRYLRGQITEAEMLEQLKNAIHHFAKRQLTWFKRNQDIIWISGAIEAEKAIKKFLK